MFSPDPRLFGTLREPLWSLLYRYWFWGWLFRDVNQGDLLGRSAAWRHNVAMRGCLPVYMARWLTCTAIAAACAHALEVALASPFLPAMFYSAAIVAVVICAIAFTIWMFLARPASG